jgi:tetratricopeptide (TPR) repeat protein
MTPAAIMIESQFQQGMAMAQQAATIEMMGNPMGAAQSFDQAIGLVGNAVNAAAQLGLPMTDQTFFALGWCSFHGARLKAAFGQTQVAAQYLAQAHRALAQAIAFNPGYFGYHSAMGTVLLAEENANMAAQSFLRAVQLNPMDSFSQWMLSSLHSAQGDAAGANYYYNTASGQQPSLPPQRAPKGSASGKASQKEWFELINNGMKLASGVLDAFSPKGDDNQSQPMWDQNQIGYR